MHNEQAPPLSAWTAILSISTRFQMQRVRSRAIKEIFDFWPRIDPADQVVLAIKHDVPDWLPLAYAALCQRKEPIEIPEARKLGLETVTLLAKAREMLRETFSTDKQAFSDQFCGADPPKPSSTISETGTLFSSSRVNDVINAIFWPKPASPEPNQQAPDLPAEPEQRPEQRVDCTATETGVLNLTTPIDTRCSSPEITVEPLPQFTSNSVVGPPALDRADFYTQSFNCSLVSTSNQLAVSY